MKKKLLLQFFIRSNVATQTYEKSWETGETMTLTLSSPVEPGGPNATTGSLKLERSGTLSGGGSNDSSSSLFLAARYSSVWSPTQFAGYINSVHPNPKIYDHKNQ